MISIENRFKGWLKGQGPKPPLGTWLMAAAPATAEAMGQSRAMVNSSLMMRPIIGREASPTRLGMMSSPQAGMKTRSPPATMPGIDSGRVMSRNTRASS